LVRRSRWALGLASGKFDIASQTSARRRRYVNGR
jgi:hypothetical protein